jgi:long-chain acyl-CoA synthetase
MTREVEMSPSDPYGERPWTALYEGDLPRDLPLPDRTALDLFNAMAAERRADPFLLFFERSISFGEVDDASHALAAELARAGVRFGDRVAVFVQNDPEFAVAQVATWKIGGILVSINPMLKEQELEYILKDSGAVAIITLDELFETVVDPVLDRTDVRLVVTTDPDLWTQTGDGGEARDGIDPGSRRVTLAEVLRRWDGEPCLAPGLSTTDIACIGYTSGTSGHPKGVRTTHANLVYNAEVYRRWMSIDDHDVFVCGTPIFHITGLVAGLALSTLTAMPLVLFHRFDAATFLALTQRWRGSFTVMAITAFQALMNNPAFSQTDLTSLTKVYSGGAAVPPATEAVWRSSTGHPVHNIYGLTETTSPSHAVPLGRDAPIDEDTGAMSVGIPVPGAEVRIVDPESLRDVPIGEPGEVWIRGPMVADGYWNLPEATAAAFVDGYLRTGDVGKMDRAGWFFIIDRLKDMINASGYKIWPREVEDFLYQHPAVREAAVVGVPDSYRGESVKAIVSLKSGATVTPDELIEFCRQQMAAYKYPRVVEIMDDLPKTVSGKILRRELRAHAIEAQTANAGGSRPNG